MLVTSQLIDFIAFVIIGMVVSIIFDFFRAYRKIKRVSTTTVIIQDIIYFFLATLVITVGIIKILDSSIRLYIFLAIIAGCGIYFSLLSKYFIKMFRMFFSVIQRIIDFVLLPLNLLLYVFVKICFFIKKYTIMCCKKIFYVVTLIRKLLKSFKRPVLPKLKLKKIKTKEV